MPESLLYWKATAAAAIVSAFFVLAIAIVAARRMNTTWLNSICVLGIGLGLSVGYYLLSLNLTWPPMSGLDRLLLIVIPTALGIELIASFQLMPNWFAWLLRACFAATISRILLHGSVYLTDWSWSQAGIVLTVSCVLLLGVWGLLCSLSERSPGVSIPLVLCLTIPCAGATVMMAGYIKGGAAAFPLSAALLATTLTGIAVTKKSYTSADFDPRMIIAVGVVGLFGVLFIGRFFGRIATAEAIILLLTPLLCWATEIPLLKTQKPLAVGSIRFVLVSIPLFFVLFAAKQDFEREMSPLLVSVARFQAPPGNAMNHKLRLPGSSRSLADRVFPGGVWEQDDCPRPIARMLEGVG